VATPFARGRLNCRNRRLTGAWRLRPGWGAGGGRWLPSRPVGAWRPSGGRRNVPAEGGWLPLRVRGRNVFAGDRDVRCPNETLSRPPLGVSLSHRGTSWIRSPQNRFGGSWEAFPYAIYRSIPLVPAHTTAHACVHPRPAGVYAGQGGSVRRRVGCGVAGGPPIAPGVDLSAVSEVQKWVIRAILFTFSTDNPHGPREWAQSGANTTRGVVNPVWRPAGTFLRPPLGRQAPTGREGSRRAAARPPTRGQAAKQPSAAGYGGPAPHGQQASPPTISTRIRQRDPGHPPDKSRTSRLDTSTPPTRQPGDKQQHPSPCP
jgi:hypothetical protein